MQVELDEDDLANIKGWFDIFSQEVATTYKDGVISYEDTLDLLESANKTFNKFLPVGAK